MRRALAAVALAFAASALSASPSSAAHVTVFEARDEGAHVRLSVYVCTKEPRRVAFTSYLRRDRADAPAYVKDYEPRHQGAGCLRWTLRDDQDYRPGRWTARLRVSIGGQRRFTPRRSLEIR